MPKEIVDKLQEQITWKLMDLYFEQCRAPVKHQIESFNALVDIYIPKIIQKNMPFVTGTGDKKYGPDKNHYALEYVLDLTNFTCIKPTQIVNGKITNMYPNECRLRSCSYSAKTYITLNQITVDYRKNENGEVVDKTSKQIPFFRLPIMVGSKYCHLYGLSPDQLNELGEDRYEPGGYFIVNGGERVIISQERITDNQFLVWPPVRSSKALVSGEIKSSINQLFYPIKSNLIYVFDKPEDNKGYFKKNFKDALTIQGAQIYYNLAINSQWRDIYIPIAVIFRAFGIISDRDITLIITETDKNSIYTKWIKPSLKFAHAIGVNDQQSARHFIARLRHKYEDPTEDDINYVSSILDKDILPHLMKNVTKKVYYIGSMVKQTLDSYLGLTEYSDRDHYANKRINLAGHLLLSIFRSKFIALINKLTAASIRELQNSGRYLTLDKDIRAIDFTSFFETSLSTGKFKTSYFDTSETGDAVCQQLIAISYIGRLCNLRRIQSPISASGSKVTKPKQLHESQCGYTCLNETPEGHDVGMIKNLALLSEISLFDNDYIAPNFVMTLCQVEDLHCILVEDIPFPCDLSKYIRIYTNADLIAMAETKYAKKIYDFCVTMKRHNLLPPSYTIELNVYTRSLIIHSDGGRFIRPVLVVEDNEVLLYKRIREDSSFAKKFFSNEFTFDDLLFSDETSHEKDKNYVATKSNGAMIEYIDPNQSEFSMIGLREKDIIEAKAQQDSHKNQQAYKKYTHCEIHPIVMQGAVSSIIPFSDHTPNPRNNYQCSMGKQAIGYFATNYNKRFDTVANALVYGQDPIVATHCSKYLCLDKLPHGVEAMLSIACYTGYNQEDSIVVNRSSIERGFFNTLNYRTYASIESKHISIDQNETFGKPEVKTQGIASMYDTIESNGEPKINSRVQKGSVLIGKILHVKKGKTFVDIDESVKYDQERGIIDNAFMPSNYKDFAMVSKCTQEDIRTGTDNTIIKVRVSNYRLPVLGDKFASRYAQKGTISGLLKESDMPFTVHGEVPDIIMNPHGMPSRSTLGKPIELFLGTIGLLSGKFMDGTPFDYVDLNNYEDILEALDFTRANSESVMINGMTGNTFNVKIFYGPMYYQRLKHMVEDKIFARSGEGKIQALTRQPAEGRSKQGGLRLGEMERDCFIAYNSTRVLKGKFFDESDKFKIYVDNLNGQVIVANPAQNKFEFNGKDIRQTSDYSEIQMPYAMKLFIQELNCLGMNICIDT